MSSLGESIQNLRAKLQSLGKRGGGAAGAASPASGASAAPKLDPKAILAWCKSNVLIVVSVAVMVAAPAAAWWFSSDLHAAADAETSKRVQEHGALEKLQKSSIELSVPGRAPEQLSGVISRRTVQAYQDLAERLRGDAMALQRMALEHNRRDRKSAIADVRITRENNNTIAETVHSAVIARADADLKRLRAGAPPSPQAVADQLQRTQDQFIAREQKPDRKSLGAEQAALLGKQLLERRLQLYADAARAISFYADRRDLGLPASAAEAGKEPTESILFGWQWRLWIVEDFLEAVAAANAPYKSVIEAPVKRVLSVSVREDAPPAKKAEGEGGAPAPAADGAAPSFTPIDPKSPVAYDFSRSMTGRVSNPMYEVRTFSVRVVVRTSALPELLNAICKQNFMTVTGLEMRPADAFLAADDGYIYGADPVSEVRMTVESLWLRQWIARLMPREMQAAKGTDGRTVDDPPPAPAEPAAEQPAT